MSILVAYQGPVAAQKVAAPPVGLSLLEEIMADVPIAYYRNRNGQGHAGTVPDHSGNNLFLSIWQDVTDAPSMDASDPSDPAWHLDAGENFWSATKWPAFDLTGDLSLSLWMRPTIFADSNERDVVRKGSQYGLTIGATSAKLVGFITSGGIGYTTANGPVLTPGTVYHVGFTYERATGTLRLYRNGALVTAETRPAPGAPVDVNSATNFVCGAYSDASHGYDGDLDEVAVFGHLLSPARMLAHYTAGSGAGLSYAGEVMADSPVAYWPMTAAGASMPDAMGGLPLALFGGAVGGEPGASTALGTAVNFDGIDDYGRVGALDLSGSDVASVEYWLRWDLYDNNDSLSLEFGENNQDGGFAHDPDSSAAGKWTAFMGPAPFYEEEMLRPAVGTWHHIVVVARRAQTGDVTVQFAFYVDGVRNEGLTSNAGLKVGNLANAPLMVMARSALANANPKVLFGDGAMQHLAVYDFELSAARVLAHYNAGV